MIRNYNYCNYCKKQLSNYHTTRCRDCWISQSRKNDPLYFIWLNMKNRCNYKKGNRYYRYGGRGISYDPLWNDFNNFKKDMGISYKNGLQLDRIDNDGNYNKNNCRWITVKEQANNRSTCHVIEFMGIEKNIKEWADELGIKRTTLDARINAYGWSIEKALMKGGNLL